jgi:flagellar motor protein MotB
LITTLRAKARTAPDPSPVLTRQIVLQRRCACGGTPGPTGECAECRKKRLQRGSAGRSEPSTAPPTVHQALRSPGQPLDAQTRVFMEGRFRYDFGRVRVHTDERAAESARAVDAHAYTVGRDIVFDAGRYAPQTRAGQHLLAHELAHVMQQAPASGTDSEALPIDEPDSALERQADVAGQRVGSPDEHPTTTTSSPVIQRQRGGAPEVGSVSTVGDLILRVNDAGQIEFLYGTPDVPVLGRVGIGFRCREGRCEPVAGSDPSKVRNRTYTLDEALGVLKGSRPGATTTPTPGGTGSGAPGPLPREPEVRLCLPWQMAPSGQCCPPGERWSFLERRCGPETATPRPETLPFPSVLPPPTLRPPGPAPPGLGLGTLQLGLPQVVVIDNFESDSDALPANAGEQLDALAEQLRLYPGEVRIEGHTDGTFTAEHNQRLSERRAESVRQALVSRGVEEGRLRTEGFGARQRLFPEDRTPEQKARNRRVSVWYRVPLPPIGTTPSLTLPELKLTPGLNR